MYKQWTAFFLAFCVLLLSGCGTEKNNPDTKVNPSDFPSIPKQLTKNREGIPVLKVYQIDEEDTVEMDVETYLMGVLAGEMKSDWPMEALKAQAILARTFVMKFCSEKESNYPAADISTDIREAQAYDATGINDRIEQAVMETKGMVLSSHGKFPYAWFHAHSGGKTALAKEGLDYEKEEPDYTTIAEGLESDKAPSAAKKWKAVFDQEDFIKAVQKCGKEITALESVALGDKGQSGRTLSLIINDTADVSAPALRIALGSTKMRSTLLDEIKVENGKIHISGRGYGHGVGMSQWGAYAMAEEGKTAKEIIFHYFKNVSLQKLW